MSTTRKVFDSLLREYTNAQGTFGQLISAEPSLTTESCYLIFSTTRDEVYSLALSDHLTDDHDLEIAAAFDDDNEKAALSTADWDALQSGLKRWLATDIRSGNMTEPDNVDWQDFGIAPARRYQTDYHSRWYSYVPERAFVAADIDDTVRIKSTYLSHHEQVLNVTYQDFTDEHEDTERYVNHVPDSGDVIDIATIYYLVREREMDVHDARKLFYSDYSWSLIEPDPALGVPASSHRWSDDGHDIYTFWGKEYLVDRADLNQQLWNHDIE